MTGSAANQAWETLTDDERAELETWAREGIYHCPCRYRCVCDDEDKVYLFDAVGSILAARLAARRVPTVEEITKVLGEHEHVWEFEVQMGREYSTISCVGDCDWSLRQIRSLLVDDKVSPSDADCYDAHRAHVASVLSGLYGEGNNDE